MIRQAEGYTTEERPFAHAAEGRFSLEVEIATNFEKYYSAPEKLVEQASCIGDCWVCVFTPLAPCSHQNNGDHEMLINWLKQEVKNDD